MQTSVIMLFAFVIVFGQQPVTWRDGCHASSGGRHRYARHSGFTGPLADRNHRALYPGGAATGGRHCKSPRPDRAHPSTEEEGQTETLTADAAAGSRAGRHLSPLRTRLPARAPFACASAQTDASHRDLPDGGPGAKAKRRPRRPVRSLRFYAHQLQLLPQPALS